MKKLKLLFSFALLFTLLFTTACSSENSEVAEEGLTETITFGLMSTIDAIPLIIAEEKGFFEDRGVNVELQTFTSARDRDAAFQAGALDGTITDLIAVGLFNQAGLDVRITGTTTGNFELLANPAIESIEDLKGKTVIVANNTGIEYSLDKILESAGLSPDDVTKEEVPSIPTRLELVRNNQSDAAILPEPFVTIGIASGLTPLATAEPIGMTAFFQNAIDEKSAEIKAFYQAYNDAVEYLNTHSTDEYIDLIIERIGFPEELRDQINLPEFKKNSLPSDEKIQSAFDWLRNRDLLTTDLQPSDVVSDIAVQ